LFFQADYNEIEFQKIGYDVMPPKNVTKNNTKFFHFGLHQSKFLATPLHSLLPIWANWDAAVSYFPSNKLSADSQVELHIVEYQQRYLAITALPDNSSISGQVFV